MNASPFGLVTPFRRLVPALFLLLTTGVVSIAQGQSLSDVHVFPRPSPGLVTHSDTGSLGSTGPISNPLVSVQIDLVLVPVLVTDSANRPITGLNKSEFTLYEDGKPQDIRYFSTEDAPISVGIVLDLSGTMAKRIDAARQALRDFFQNSNLKDEYFVITFADRPQVIAESTSSADRIEQSLSTVTTSGHTALLDAVHLGLQKLRSARYDRRALLVVSDGEDNWSRFKSGEIADEIEESGDYVYGIGLFSDAFPILSALEVASGKRLLNKLCEPSGGRAIMVYDLQNLPAAAATIAREMRDQYVLGYNPDRVVHTGERRKIKISVASHPSPHRFAPLHLDYKKTYSAPLN